METTPFSLSVTPLPVNEGSYKTQAYFPLKPGTKEPAITAWQTTAPGMYPAIGGYGINLQASDLIVDADPRNYPPGRDVLQELMVDHPFPVTLIVSTPRGGWHIYMRKAPGYKVRRHQSRYPGIDFLSEGAFVCGPGTQTVFNAEKDTVDGVYSVATDAPIAEIPVTLLASLEHPAEAETDGAEMSLLKVEQFQGECETTAPAISGQGGDSTTYQVACRGRDLALPLEVTYRIMRDYFNPRCDPPWNENDLRKKVANAYAYARNAAGNASPEAKFLSLLTTAGPPENVISLQKYQDEIAITGIYAESLDIKNNGELKNTLGNVITLLRTEPAWKGRLKFNEFSKAYEFPQRPDWRRNQLNEGVEINDRDIACITAWFSSAGHVRLEVPQTKLWQAIYAAATSYHPVRDYLESLEWDGVERLERLLIDTAGAPDMAYVRAAGKALLIGAVKRIFEPGCKMDYVLVLEGRQGTKKSTWVEELGKPWYSASELVRGDKDTYQNLRGRWIVELPEINATFSKHDFNWLKGVISSAVDNYRPSYERVARPVPRESVFVATINPDATASYLKDDENRRYWPIETTAFNIQHLRDWRDQYFAEAVARYRRNEPCWIDDPTAEAEMKNEQKRRKEKDVWADLLRGWSVAHEATGFTSLEAFSALGGVPANLNSGHRQRLYRALNELGFEFDHNTNRWEKPGAINWEALV